MSTEDLEFPKLDSSFFDAESEFSALDLPSFAIDPNVPEPDENDQSHALDEDVKVSKQDLPLFMADRENIAKALAIFSTPKQPTGASYSSTITEEQLNQLNELIKPFIITGGAISASSVNPAFNYLNKNLDRLNQIILDNEVTPGLEDDRQHKDFGPTKPGNQEMENSSIRRSSDDSPQSMLEIKEKSMQIRGTAAGLSSLYATRGLDITPDQIREKGREAITEGLSHGLGKENLRTLTKAVIWAQGWLNFRIDNNLLKFQIFDNARRLASKEILSIKSKGVPKEKLPEELKMLEKDKKLKEMEQVYTDDIKERIGQARKRDYPLIAEAYHAGLDQDQAIALVFIEKSTATTIAYSTARNSVADYNSDKKNGLLQVVLPDRPRPKNELLAILKTKKVFIEKGKQAYRDNDRLVRERKKRANLSQEKAETNQSSRAKKSRSR